MNDPLSILKRIADAYPDKRMDQGTLQLYLDELADIPTPLLDRVVRHHIQTSPWFPHVSDLRQAAQQLTGSTNFASLPEPGVNFLDLEAHQLEKDYYQRGKFDLNAWDQLANRFENVGRFHRAEELRHKAHHIQESESAYQRGEQYPPEEVYLRYARWDNHAEKRHT